MTDVYIACNCSENAAHCLWGYKSKAGFSAQYRPKKSFLYRPFTSHNWALWQQVVEQIGEPSPRALGQVTFKKSGAEETQRWNPLHSLRIPLGILRIRSAYASYTRSVLFSWLGTSFIFINVMQGQVIDSHFSRSPEGYSHSKMVFHSRQGLVNANKITESNMWKGNQDKPAWLVQD